MTNIQKMPAVKIVYDDRPDEMITFTTQDGLEESAVVLNSKQWWINEIDGNGESLPNDYVKELTELFLHTDSLNLIRYLHSDGIDDVTSHASDVRWRQLIQGEFHPGWEPDVNGIDQVSFSYFGSKFAFSEIVVTIEPITDTESDCHIYGTPSSESLHIALRVPANFFENVARLIELRVLSKIKLQVTIEGLYEDSRLRLPHMPQQFKILTSIHRIEGLDKNKPMPPVIGAVHNFNFGFESILSNKTDMLSESLESKFFSRIDHFESSLFKALKSMQLLLAGALTCLVYIILR
jgi:hypothetical protein